MVGGSRAAVSVELELNPPDTPASAMLEAG